MLKTARWMKDKMENKNMLSNAFKRGRKHTRLKQKPLHEVTHTSHCGIYHLYYCPEIYASNSWSFTRCWCSKCTCCSVEGTVQGSYLLCYVSTRMCLQVNVYYVRSIVFIYNVVTVSHWQLTHNHLSDLMF